jgi:hypothetical protein
MKKLKEYKTEVLDQEVDQNSELKQMLVSYVGKKLDPKDDLVTVSMIVEVMGEEFPEFVLAIAEENYLRGYEQAVSDLDTWQSQTSLENPQDE